MTLQLDLTLLVLLAAFAHAAWNVLLKSSGDQFLTFTMLRVVAFVLGWAAVMMAPAPVAAAWPYLIASAIIHNVYYVLLLYSYRHGDLSLVYPIARGGAPFLVALAAAPIAGEIPGPSGALGIALISAGILGLAFAGGRPKGKGGAAIALAAGTAVAVVAYTLTDGLGARLAGNPSGYIAWLFVLESVPFILFTAATRGHAFIEHAKHAWRRGLGGGVLMMATYALVIYAFTQGPLAYVSALRETSVLFAAIIGWVVLKESFGLRRVAWASVIVAGIALVQLGG